MKVNVLNGLMYRVKESNWAFADGYFEDISFCRRSKHDPRKVNVLNGLMHRVKESNRAFGDSDFENISFCRKSKHDPRKVDVEMLINRVKDYLFS